MQVHLFLLMAVMQDKSNNGLKFEALNRGPTGVSCRALMFEPVLQDKPEPIRSTEPHLTQTQALPFTPLKLMQHM